MAEKYQGLIAQIKNEGYEEGINQGLKDGKNQGLKDGERNVISELLQTFSIEVVADLLHKGVQEIQNIIDG